MAESTFRNIPSPPLANLPVVRSTDVDGFFQASTRLQEATNRKIRNNQEAELTRQGIVDGQQGKLNTELLYAPTFRGRAYTKAAENSFLQTIELNTTRRIQGIIGQNPTDTEKAKQEISAYLNGVVNAFPPAMKERFGQTFLLKSQIRANVGLSQILNRERRALANKVEVDALAKDRQRSVDIVENAEGLMDPDPSIQLKSTAAIIEQRAQIESEYGAKILDEDGREIAAFNPLSRQRALQQFDIDTSNSAIKSAFDNSSKKVEFLQQFEDNKLELRIRDEMGDVVLDLRPDVRRKSALVNYMQAQIARENAAANRQLREFRSEVAEAVQIWKAGGNVPDQTIASMKVRAHQLNDEQSFNEIIDWSSFSNEMSKMALMSPANLQAVVNARRAEMEATRNKDGSISRADIQQMEAMEGLLGNMSTQLARDPVSWANRVGLIQSAPVIFTDQETVDVGGQQINPQVLMKKRMADAQSVSDHYGIPPQFLTDEEKATFARFISDRNTSAEQVLGVIESTSGFGEFQDEVLAEMAEKAPVYMHIAGLMRQGSSDDVLFAASEGQKIIQGFGEVKGTTIITPSSADAREVTGKVLGTAFAQSPQTRRSVIDTAAAIYSSRGLRAGLTGEELDEDLWIRSLQEASGATFKDGVQFGGISSFNGFGVAIPNFMEADQFEDFINEMNSDDWQNAGFNGPPIVPLKNGKVGVLDMPKEIEVFDDLHLISVDDGKYIVARNAEGSDPQFIRGNADPRSPIGAVRSGFYVLDLRRIPEDRRAKLSAAAELFFMINPDPTGENFEVPQGADVTRFDEIPGKIKQGIQELIE